MDVTPSVWKPNLNEYLRIILVLNLCHEILHQVCDLGFVMANQSLMS